MPEPRANPAPKISADPNDVTGYRRPGSRVRDGGGRSGLGSNLLLVVLFGGLVAAGWFITTQHQQLVKAETALTQADHRLAVLEERLQVTDQVMSESGTEVQSKLGQWETEIKKLWDANKRDKQLITDDQTKLKEHDGSIEGMQTALKDLKSSDARQEQALAQQTAIAQQLASVDQEVKQLVAQQRQLTDQVNAARQSVSGLETGLTKRVVANEKAIEAIDAYRLQLNSRLVDLQTRIDSVAPAKSP
jgi:chromosome segregation ATPase